MLDQDLYRHTSALEYQRSVHHLGVPGNYVFLSHDPEPPPPAHCSLDANMTRPGMPEVPSGKMEVTPSTLHCYLQSGPRPVRAPLSDGEASGDGVVPGDRLEDAAVLHAWRVEVVVKPGAPRPYAQAGDRRTLVEATGYRPSLRRRCPRVEALVLSDPLVSLRSELGKRAKGQQSSTQIVPPARGAEKTARRC
jgi:hypothetical protein